jgi:hypothetical protein
VTSQGVAIGFTRQGQLVRVPVASSRAVMSLVLGATGSGKTIVQVLLALAAIKREFGVIYIDPKGDDFVLEELRAAAARAGNRCLVWDPQGSTIYNPYDRGTDTEIGDKLLAAEVFTEPHYQRLAQRYIGHVVRALRLAGVEVSLATVVEHMHNGRLSSLTRKMSPTDARPLLAYLETMTPQQERDLAGARDRLRSSLSRTSVISWTRPPRANKSISASHSSAATSSCFGSRRIDAHWQQRCWAPRSSRISSRSAKNVSAESTDPPSSSSTNSQQSERRRPSACSAAGAAAGSARCWAPKRPAIWARP